MLNGLQPFMALSVSYLSLGFIRLSEPVLLIQFLDLSNLRPETPYFFSKNLKMIHITSITYLRAVRGGVLTADDVNAFVAVRRLAPRQGQ